MDNKIAVFKDGSYISIPDGVAWEYENDPTWLVTIPINNVPEKFAEWVAQNYHHSMSLKGEHFWEEKILPRRAGNPIASTIEIYIIFDKIKSTSNER